MTQEYFNEHIQGFLLEYERNTIERDHSFDYCQLYFHQHYGDFLTNNLEQSCFVLWGYLAGFGMLRGSSLRTKNPSALVPVIEYIAANDLYDIDLDDYQNQNDRERVITAYSGIENALHHLNPSHTLISKIILGVYSCLPALDSYFLEFVRNEWHLRFRYNHLEDLNVIMQRMYQECEQIQFPILYLRQFDGQDSEIQMKKIRLIDRVGWELGA